MNRLIVVARFAPEARERVKELLSAGPPFDPAEAGMDRHAVYLSAREAVFVFEGPDVEVEVEDLADDFFHPELQAALGEWRELIEDEPHIAREVYSWTREGGAGAPAAADGEATVADLMSGDFVTVAPEDTIGESVEKLAAAGAPLALVADYGRFIGVLGAGDVLRAVANRAHPSEARVRTWMEAEPARIAADASPEEAAERMVETGTHHLPVVEGERAAGVVSLHAIVAGRTLPARA